MVGSVILPRACYRRKETLPRLRNKEKAIKARIAGMERDAKGIPTLSQENPICSYLYKVRDAQAKEIRALRARLESPVFMPGFFAAIAPAKQYVVRSVKGTEYQRAPSAKRARAGGGGSDGTWVGIGVRVGT